MNNTVYDVLLDAEEQELLDSVERGEWEPIPNMEEEMQRLQQSAKAHLDKKRGYSVLITYDELVEAQEMLSAQLHGGGYLPKTDQNIKSLLEKIEAAIENLSSTSNGRNWTRTSDPHDVNVVL